MRAAVRIALGPVLLLQGKRVRREILRLPEADGPRAGMAGDGPELSVLILGDSSAAGVGAATQDEALSGQLAQALGQTHKVRWQVLAKTGWTTRDGLDALPRLNGASFDVAVVALGVNDVTTETGLTRWLDQYRNIMDRLRADHGVGHFILSGLPPMGRFPALPQPLRWYMGLQSTAHDRALKALAAKAKNVRHVPLALDSFSDDDIAHDGFHPGPGAYTVWGSMVADAVRDITKDRSVAERV